MVDKIYGLDFETFSPVNLPEKGADNYRQHPDFEPVLATLVYPSGHKERYGYGYERDFIDLINSLKIAVHGGGTIACHNVSFERGVVSWLHKQGVSERLLKALVDSAVMARLLGAGSKLAAASRQLTKSAKLEVGKELMGVFCWPHEGYDKPSLEYIEAHLEEWEEFGDYCDVDALGAQEIVRYGIELLNKLNAGHLWERECEFEWVTYCMNRVGWKVDRESVEWMHKRGWANAEIAKIKFTQGVGADLNFRSPAQLKAFAKERGVTWSSLDKYHAPVVLDEVTTRWQAEEDETKKQQLWEVMTMLEIKMEIGGATLSKTKAIKNIITPEDVIHDAYIHLGAGQTFRTTGTKVQMQNLARLSGEIRDLSTLSDYQCEWTNTDMAGQFRQVFTAHHEDGELIVGDFSAVESRGLAFLAGEEWKLAAYEDNLDVYKVLVTKYNNIEYEEVTSEMRPKGKYTELSCGYQASGKAVKDVMFKYGFNITLEEAAEWVSDWRKANPAVTQFWFELDNLLKAAVMSNIPQEMTTPLGPTIVITPFQLSSVAQAHPGSTSLAIQIYVQPDKPFVTRFIHGVYPMDKGLAYYKPVEYYTSEKGLWNNVNETATQKANKGKKRGRDKFVTVLNTIYGGKLAGILVQSFCREMFFESLQNLHEVIRGDEYYDNCRIVGQFHDEIVVDWHPVEGQSTLEEAMEMVNECMSITTVDTFPLVADIKHAYRYIK